MVTNIGRRILLTDLRVFGTVVDETSTSFIVKGKDDADYQRLVSSRYWYFVSQDEFDSENVR